MHICVTRPQWINTSRRSFIYVCETYHSDLGVLSYLGLCMSVGVFVNILIFRLITRDTFKLGAPNLDHMFNRLHPLHVVMYLDRFTVPTVSQLQSYGRYLTWAAGGISACNVALVTISQEVTFDSLSVKFDCMSEKIWGTAMWSSFRYRTFPGILEMPFSQPILEGAKWTKHAHALGQLYQGKWHVSGYSSVQATSDKDHQRSSLKHPVACKCKEMIPIYEYVFNFETQKRMNQPQESC